MSETETQPLNRIHSEEKAKPLKRTIRSDSPPRLRPDTKKPWKTIFLVKYIFNISSSVFLSSFCRVAIRN